MKHFLFSIYFLFLSHIVFCQDFFKGQVINKTTGEIVPYVNIGFIEKGVGTISNKEGNFSLKTTSEIKLNDTITFSCIGYKTKEIDCKQLTQVNKVYLQPDTVFLEAVNISSKAKGSRPHKPKKLGKAHKVLAFFHNYFHIYGKAEPDNLGRERGMIFKLKKNCDLQALNFHIGSNQYKSVKFRLHFYTIENGKPKALISDHKEIIFTVKDQFRGWHQLDLKPYSIQFDKSAENIGVTLQWVDSEKTDENSKYFSISAALASKPHHLSRDEVMGKWKMSKYKLNFNLEYLENQS